MPIRTAATDAEVAALLADFAAGKLCDELTGAFVPLRDVGAAGALAGEVPVTGRWWVQSCTVERVGAQVVLRLAGFGWKWADKEESGFRVAQYVYFRATASVSGALDLGYDPMTNVSSVWFTPAGPPHAEGQSLGKVNAEADSFVTTLFVIATVGWLDDHADEEAQEKADRTVAPHLRTALGRGFTVTYSLATGQRDGLLQLLPRGAVPARPFKEPVQWLVNGRWDLQGAPGALHVAGPFRKGRGARIDVRIERGARPRFRIDCEQDVVNWLAPVTRGIAPTSAPGLAARSAADTLELPVPPCPRWYVTAQSEGRATFSVRVRVEE